METLKDSAELFGIDVRSQTDSEGLSCAEFTRFSMETPQAMGNVWCEGSAEVLETELGALPDCEALMTGQHEALNLDTAAVDQAWSTTLLN